MYKTVLLPRRFHRLLLRSLSLTALPPSAAQSGEIGRSDSSLRDVDSLETRNQKFHIAAMQKRSPINEWAGEYRKELNREAS
jgi:hypothetical protein